MAVVISVAYGAGAFRLDVTGMAAVVFAHGLWYALVGIVTWQAGADRGR